MRVSFFMNRARLLNIRINMKLRSLDTLKEAETDITKPMQPDPVSHTRNVHSMEDVIVKKVDLEREIDAEVDRYVEIKQEIQDVIDQLDNPLHQSILELRYLYQKEWPEIIAIMGFSRSYTYKIHSAALEAAQKVLDLMPDD